MPASQRASKHAIVTGTLSINKELEGGNVYLNHSLVRKKEKEDYT